MGSGGRRDPAELEWRQIYRDYEPSLRRLIRSLAPASEVDDILQDTFERLGQVQARGRLDLSRPIEPLLVTLAKRASIANQRRARSARQGGWPDELGTYFDFGTDCPEADPGWSEATAAAIKSLRPRDRRLLIRCVVEETPRAEVAAEEGLSPGAIRVALFHARRRFRTAYAATTGRRATATIGSGLWSRARGRLQSSVPMIEKDLELALRGGLGAAVAVAAAAAAVTLSLTLANTPGNATDDLVLAAVEAGRRTPGAATATLALTAGASRQPQETGGAPDSGGPPPPVHERSTVVRVRRAETTASVDPSGSVIGVRLDWSDALGDGRGSTGIEFRCNHGLVATATCPLLRGLPATSERHDSGKDERQTPPT